MGCYFHFSSFLGEKHSKLTWKFRIKIYYRVFCQKPAHYLSPIMALVSTFLQMFIVLGMYNFGIFFKIINANLLCSFYFCKCGPARHCRHHSRYRNRISTKLGYICRCCRKIPFPDRTHDYLKWKWGVDKKLKNKGNLKNRGNKTKHE